MAKMLTVTDESAPTYGAPDDIISRALDILRGRVVRQGVCQDPTNTRHYLVLLASTDPDQTIEQFRALWLDAQNQIINVDTLAAGTISSATVYPREVVKRAIASGAAAVIFTHNHPSGNATPSDADRTLTRRLKDALALVDVAVLDHIITAGGESCSMLELGTI